MKKWKQWWSLHQSSGNNRASLWPSLLHGAPWQRLQKALGSISREAEWPSLPWFYCLSDRWMWCHWSNCYWNILLTAALLFKRFIFHPGDVGQGDNAEGWPHGGERHLSMQRTRAGSSWWCQGPFPVSRHLLLRRSSVLLPEMSSYIFTLQNMQCFLLLSFPRRDVSTHANRSLIAPLHLHLCARNSQTYQNSLSLIHWLFILGQGSEKSQVPVL